MFVRNLPFLSLGAHGSLLIFPYIDTNGPQKLFFDTAMVQRKKPDLTVVVLDTTVIDYATLPLAFNFKRY